MSGDMSSLRVEPDCLYTGWVLFSSCPSLSFPPSLLSLLFSFFLLFSSFSFLPSSLPSIREGTLGKYPPPSHYPVDNLVYSVPISKA